MTRNGNVSVEDRLDRARGTTEGDKARARRHVTNVSRNLRDLSELMRSVQNRPGFRNVLAAQGRAIAAIDTIHEAIDQLK